MNAPHETTDALAQHLLRRPWESLDTEERRVIEAMIHDRPISRDAGEDAEDLSTFGERLADRVAAVADRGRSSSASGW